MLGGSETRLQSQDHARTPAGFAAWSKAALNTCLEEELCQVALFYNHLIYKYKVPLRGTIMLMPYDQASHLFEVACMVFNIESDLRPDSVFNAIFALTKYEQIQALFLQ